MIKIIKTFLIITLLLTNTSWSKTIEFVVPWAPGGTADQLTQIIAPQAKAEFSKQNINLNIVYRPGAGSLVGTNSVSRTDPGNIQILLGNNAMITATVFNASAVNYDLQDFTIISYIGYIPMLTVVNSASKIQTIQDWISACRHRNLNYGTAGVGSNTHISGLLLNSMLGCNGVPVPYKGTAPAVTDLLGGHLDYFSDYLSGVLPYIENNRLTPILVLDQRRLPELPNVPAITELTKKDYNFTNWFVLLANSSADTADIQLAKKIFSQILLSPQINAKLKEIGIQKKHTVGPDFLQQERRNFLQVINRVEFK